MATGGNEHAWDDQDGGAEEREPPLARAGDRRYKQGVSRDPHGGAGDTSRLEFHLAGVFGVVRGGVQLTDGDLGSRKARTLMKLLTVERTQVVSVDRIASVLWPGDLPAKPAQHVATLVSRLRRALGPDVICGGRQGYQFAAHMSCDK